MSSYPVAPALVSSALISPCPCAACRHGRGADQPVREPRYTSDMSSHFKMVDLQCLELSEAWLARAEDLPPRMGGGERRDYGALGGVSVPSGMTLQPVPPSILRDWASPCGA